ncbi:MAG TPA: hypothetical protein VF601_12645 [Beijerinckiaceae bacterium]|jgi:hypothetical protein
MRAGLLFACAVAGVAACTPVDKVYRPLSYAEPDCREQRQLVNRAALAEVNNDERRLPPRWAECMLQLHDNPPPGHKLARIPSRSAYHLAYLEFGEDGRLLHEQQKQELLAHLARKERNYLIVYVHGWRHDAHVGDENARRFRVFLSYARSFIEERCKEKRRYCDATVTGLYVGWRGQSYTDCPDETDSPLCDIVAAPTIWARKAVSERIAPSVIAELKDIQRSLRLTAPGRFAGNRMLVLGHSFGGNILATGLRNDFEAAIAAHAPGKTLHAPLGNLVVLFNPAAEAEKWTSLQRAVHAREGAAVQAGRPFFAPSQKPVYLSLTSACHWPADARDLRDRKIDCDTATGTLFPISKVLVLDAARERRTAIGHLDAEPGGEQVGTSHEFEINTERRPPQPDPRGTSYAHAALAETSQCLIVDGWLTRAKHRARLIHKDEGEWDAGYKRDGIWYRDDDVALAPINRRLNEGLNGQFRHAIFRGRPSPTSAHDPFWNVRALDTAVENHGRFFNYPTWCAINQLVLDDVAGPAPMRRAPAEVALAR